MKRAGIIGKYAIGGAFAAILHYEPISTIDLNIFFFLREQNGGRAIPERWCKWHKARYENKSELILE
jgi:hypothetical protein